MTATDQQNAIVHLTSDNRHRDPCADREAVEWNTLAVMFAFLTIAGCDSSAQKYESARGNAVAVKASALEARDAARKDTTTWKLPEQVPGDGFLSSQACQRCHEKSHASWSNSFHRSMTQLPSENSIKAPFDGRKLTRGEVSCSVHRRGEKFWVTTPDPDIEQEQFQNGMSAAAPSPPLVDREVALVTGSHHMQIYWLPGSDGNELLIFPWVFSIDLQRWIPYEDSFVVPPTMPKLRANWNANCIACHSLNGAPNYDLKHGQFKSEVVEFGISCEACHGPGESHVRWREDARNGAEKGTDPIVHPAHMPEKIAAQICGQCHTDFTREEDYYTNGPRYRAGGDLDAAQKTIDFEARKDPRHPFHGSHWEDGTGRVGGREYLGLIASACFQKGQLTCITCHSMHDSDPNQQLKSPGHGNDVCLNCHQAISQDISAHTHHALNSSGSECYNCHMPRTSYALFRAMRSHRVDIPSAATSAASGRPIACNLCHLDKSLLWTAERMQDWYGTDVPAAVQSHPQNGAKTAASIEWLLEGDAAQRVVTAWHFGWGPAHEASGADWEAPVLAELLDDPYSAVRLVAGRSLKTLPNMSELDFDFLSPTTARQNAKQRAIDLWRSSPRQPTLNPTAVLQLDSGELNEKEIRRMLRSQNQRPVVLSE